MPLLIPPFVLFPLPAVLLLPLPPALPVLPEPPAPGFAGVGSMLSLHAAITVPHRPAAISIPIPDRII
jgi:hypothetical protein